MVDYKGLRSLHLKKIADILPGEVFKLDDEEGYISYFLDQTEDGSDLNNALSVFRDALASRDPLSTDDVCRIVDAYRIIDFLSKKEMERFTPVLYREMAGEYERNLNSSMNYIKVIGTTGLIAPTPKDEARLEKSKAIAALYEARVAFCRQQSEGVAVETPSEAAPSPKHEKRGSGGFGVFGRKSKEAKEAKKEPAPMPVVEEEPKIPGGFAVPVEDEKEELKKEKTPFNNTASAENKPVMAAEKDNISDEKPFVFKPKDDDEDEVMAEIKASDVASIAADTPVKVFTPKDDDEDEIIPAVKEEPRSEEVKPFTPIDDDEPVYEDIKPAMEIPAAQATPADLFSDPAAPVEENPTVSVFNPKEKHSFATPVKEEVKPAPVIEKAKPVVNDTIKPVFTGAFGQKEQQEQNLRNLEVAKAKTEAGDIPCYERSLTFTGYLPCKDMKNYALVFVKNTVYFGRMENIKGNSYDNSDESLLELTRVKANNTFVSLMTEDRTNTDTAFTDDEKKTIQIYFNFVTAVFNAEVGKSVTANEYMRFKKHYNRLIDRMLELEEDETILYYKALMYADRYLSYARAYNLELADDDRDHIARLIMNGDVTGIIEDFDLIKEYHIVDEDAKAAIEDYSHLIEIFPDDEKEEEKLPELPAIYKNKEITTDPEPETLPPGAAMPVYDNGYGGGYGGYSGYGGGYGAPPPYGQQYQQPATPVQVIVNNNFPGATSNSGTNNQQK